MYKETVKIRKDPTEKLLKLGRSHPEATSKLPTKQLLALGLGTLLRDSLLATEAR